MDAGPEQPPAVSRLALPWEGTACGVVFATLFVGFFCALAVSNLVAPSTPIIGHVASVLWLALVAFTLGLAVWEVGLRGSAVTVLGAFAWRHFVEARREGERVAIGFGFELFGRTFYYERVEGEWVVSVDMTTGQASHFAGRDMNDWHVALWYRDPNVPPRTFGTFTFDKELYLVGPGGAKARVGEFFAALVGFLRAAGVDLRPTEKETEFRVPEPPAPPPSPAPSA